MNTRTKRRMVVATGIIVIVLVVVLAVVGGNSAAKTVTVAQALEPSIGDKKIQVSGNVVDDSIVIDGDLLTFELYDAEADPAAQQTLKVRYDGGVSATFGDGMTAICTGKKGDDGVLVCSELVTKCPSKYEDATGALTISDLLGYGDSVVGKPVKVTGIIALNTLAGVDAPERFTLKEVVPVDSNDETALHVRYDGAMPGGAKEGSTVVLTGALDADGSFAATDVALGA